MRIVRVAGGDVADRRLGLNGHELHEVFDGVHRPSGVRHLPHHHGRDFDGDALGVVHLGQRCLVVPDLDRDGAPSGQRIDPVEAAGADGPGVPPEDLQHERLARRHRGQPGQADAPQHEER
jgi:hypothetical protein